MSAFLMFALVVTMVGTSFLSGIFGMAGGLILMGVLLALLPVPEAMSLHAVTQMASNGWRGLLWWQHVRWRAAAAFLFGCAVAFVLWTFWRYVPSKPVAFLLLGVTPFLVRVVPSDLKPDPERLLHGTLYGAFCMTLMLLTGVSGPLIDTYFLGGGMERRQIVATKAVCQVFSHGAKFAYFGGRVDLAAGLDPWMAALAIAASMIGTSLARPILDRLTDTQYRRWATHIITTIAVAYLAQGSYLLLWPSA
jgi:uncharacterized membrane protein YfcA